MVRNNVTRKKSRDPDLKWAKHTIRDIRRTIRRTLKLYDFRMDKSNLLYHVRPKVRRSNKKKTVEFTQKKFKYVLEEPRCVKRTLEIDTKQKDTKCRDSMALEINSLIDIDCFQFKPAGTETPDSEFQYTTLHCVFLIKHDLIRKSMLVAGGHLIYVPTDLQIYSSQKKTISVKLIGAIADKVGLKQLSGYVSYSYVNMDTSHKVYVPFAGT